MNVNCNHRERILRDQEPEALAALQQHAEQCAECRAELALWNAISAAAPLLRKNWESPDLWPRMRQALAEQSQGMQGAEHRRGFAGLWALWAANWKPAIAAAALVVLTVIGLFRLPDLRRPRQESRTASSTFLTEQAMKDVERKEAEYIQSIEKLAALAGQQVQQPSSALMASYREKLIVLDAAIVELRAQVERNRFNAHLRRELALLYADKQKTLEALAQGDANAR